MTLIKYQVTAKIFSDQDKSHLIDEDAGIFTSKILERFPHHPKAEDVDLDDEHFRENFLTAVFTLSDFRQVKSMDDLFQFHNQHNYIYKKQICRDKTEGVI